MLMETPTSSRRFVPAVVCAKVRFELPGPRNVAELEVVASTATCAQRVLRHSTSRQQTEEIGKDPRADPIRLYAACATLRSFAEYTLRSRRARSNQGPPTPLNLALHDLVVPPALPWPGKA